MRVGHLVLSIALIVAAACGKNPAPPPPPPADAPSDESSDVGSEQSVSYDELATALEASERDRRRLRRTLAQQTDELSAIEEGYASLELELASALEELLRSQANLRSVQSRAFAVSRISEVRVKLDDLKRRKDSAISGRLERAAAFLERADRALVDDNVGGAAYLADRAGELVRQATTVADRRKNAPTELLPIVPPRVMEARGDAVLRGEPSAESDRVGALRPGESIEVVARLGNWFRVSMTNGAEAWVHRARVR